MVRTLTDLSRFRFCFICTLFELMIFTNEMANHFGLTKEALGLR